MNSEIKNEGFRLAAQGYDVDQVDGFVFDLLIQLDRAQSRIADLEDQLLPVPLAVAS